MTNISRGDRSDFWLFLKLAVPNEKTYGGENLPSVDPLSELVAFQGPPKLTTLDISSLHIPRHVHHRSNRRYSRRATKWKKPQIFTVESRKKSTVSRARLLSVSFVVIRLRTDSRFYGGLPSS